VSQVNALEVSGAVKRFGQQTALAGLNLDVARGEWVALLGPNGAGKTTLMRAIAGLTTLAGGEITALGARVVAGRGAPEGLGLVPQKIALYPELTADENLDIFGRMHGLRGERLRERVEWALSWTGLDHRRDDPVGAFSGGMQRRLNIAAGVLHAPRLVLLDEPTVGVDPQARDRISEMLCELRSDGAALVQSTHQFSEIEGVCDRVVIVDHGRVVASGTPADLVREVANQPRPFLVRVDRHVEVSFEGRTLAGDRLGGLMSDVATGLPELLRSVAEAGANVVDVQVEAPGIEAVFKRLTGRELRE
jgi:ABC-2 type transport system ATP-binding protein